MRSPCLFTLSYDTFVIHQRGRGDRKIYDRDSSARNYCYSRRVQILACIRTGGGLGVGEPLAQLLIWYSRWVRKGRWSGTPDPCLHIDMRTRTHTCAHKHTHSLSLTHTQTQSMWKKNTAPCLCWLMFACERHISSWFWRLHGDPHWPFYLSLASCFWPELI